MEKGTSMPDLVCEWDEARAREVISAHRAAPGGLLPALRAIQAEFGHIPKPAIGFLGKEFNVSRAEVFGVATFYHDFRLDGPAGQHVLKLCRGEACQAVGADALASLAKQRLCVDWHQTTTDRKWTLEPVFCLGLCACAPSALLDGEPVARLSAERLGGLLAKDPP
jgi:formate dehydrogenase subunit gamma